MADQSEQEENLEPLVIFYDSEASNGNVYYGDVIEIAATCHPGVVVGSFERLINTKRNLGSFAINESGITEDLLEGMPFIDKVTYDFLDWIGEMVVLAQKKNNTRYFPVLCAHGGYQFDFLILFANLERKGMPYSKFSDCNIHFADSFLFCQKLQQDGNKYLQDTRLSIDGLFHKFFPKHTIKGRHRAMGDVKAMVKIFTQTPLKNVLNLMSVSTTLERIKYFVSQSSSKEQQLILEEKMSSLDACSRNMCSKRLIREGLTYDLLKTVFQKCSSYMDFWQTLKKIGIERKIAKHFTSQFSAMGLENQGSLGYALHAAMQNGSLTNGSSQDSNGHANTDVNGNLGTEKRNSIISGSSKSSLPTSKSDETHSSKAKVVIGTTDAERATSSSRAFEERPLDYAVTSSAGDERLKAYSLLRSALKQQDNEKDDSKNVLAANGRERRSCQETSTGIESLSSENTSSSGDPSVCNGDENWDSEIENTVTRGHFVLQFNEVIPTSIVFEDVSSSSGGPSTEKHRDLKASNSKRAPTQPETNPGKRNIGNMKDSEQEKRHEYGQAKKGGESSVGFIKSRKNTKSHQTTVDLVRSNKMTKKEIPVTKSKSNGDAVSSEDGKQGTLISSAGTEGLKQVGHNRSDGNLSKVTDEADNKTLSSPAKKIGRKVIDDQKRIKTNRRSKVSSKKTPSSVTFVTPVERTSVDPSDLPQGDVEMTTVYVGDFPILVPAQKQSVPCEDSLGQPTREDQELEIGNRHISTDGNTISREEGFTLQNAESPRNPTSEAEGMVLSKEIEGRKQDMDGFEELAQYLEKTPLQNTTVPDKVQQTSTSESVSSSSHETSDTGSNLGYIHQTSPPPSTEENDEQGKNPSNVCPSDDNADTSGETSGDQASVPAEQVNHQPTAPTTEEHSPCDMETEETIKTDRDSENVCGDIENQAVTDQGGLTVEPSSEADINPNMATQEQLNGFLECPWPSSDIVYPNPAMYPVPQQYPFQMPYTTAMPSAYGFYPSLPHMMTMIPGPQHVPYPPMSFASQGMMPFGGFPPRFPMQMPMFPPPIYPTGQEGQRPYLDMFEHEPTQQTLSSSPEVLGIPDNRIQTLEHQNNKTPTVISNVSYSTSSDDHSARSSPFPVDDSSNKTTPLTTPHRSPIDGNSSGALSSSEKGGKSDLTQNKRKEYRKDARPARYHTDERSRRSNRNGPWKGSTYRDRKDISEKGPRADLGEAAGDKTRGRDGGSKKRTKVKKEDSHSRHVQELSDQDIKLDSSSPKMPSNSPKSEQLTPRREARDVKSAHGTSKISPHNSRNVQSGHASPTISRSEKLTPTRKVEEDHSSKTSRSDTRSEESGPSPKEKRNASTDPVIQQMASTISKSSQALSTKSAHTESHKSQRSVEINKRWPKDRVESQKSSHTSKLHAPPSKTSSRDRALKVGSISPKEAAKQSLPAQPLAMYDKKNEKLVSSEREPKSQDQKDEPDVTASGSINKEVARHRPNESRNAEARKIKWPQSALANEKFKELPKPQRDPSSRTRRVRDSHSSGSERENRPEAHGNKDVKGTTKSTDATAGENKFKDNKTTSEKEQFKEPFSTFAEDLETKGEDRLKDSTGHQSDSRSSNNYRDVLLGKQSTKPSYRTNETASSDDVKEGSSSAMKQRPDPQLATTVKKIQPMPESGTIKNLVGTPQPGDREKPLRKEHRQEKEPLKKQSYKESRELNTPRGSTMSRGPTPYTSTRNPGRYRHYDTNKDNNFQSRNTVSKATKS